MTIYIFFIPMFYIKNCNPGFAGAIGSNDMIKRYAFNGW